MMHCTVMKHNKSTRSIGIKANNTDMGIKLPMFVTSEGNLNRLTIESPDDSPFEKGFVRLFYMLIERRP